MLSVTCNNDTTHLMHWLRRSVLVQAGGGSHAGNEGGPSEAAGDGQGRCAEGFPAERHGGDLPRGQAPLLPLCQNPADTPRRLHSHHQCSVLYCYGSLLFTVSVAAQPASQSPNSLSCNAGVGQNLGGQRDKGCADHQCARGRVLQQAVAKRQPAI